ncbi:conserved hypothetical protein [Vibrio phage 496E54-1]|nr:conserved hypothetical protein [Vibrio phage 495E54-1]CAH9012350.1 conserved hypothetical protein [Vibrio phage 496E54-1]
MTNPDQLLKTLVDTSCHLDSYFGVDMGMGDMITYLFVTEEGLGHCLQMDDEWEIQWESNTFKVVTSPNWEYTLVLNKSYRYE